MSKCLSWWLILIREYPALILCLCLCLCPVYPIHWSSPYLLRAWGQSKLPSSSGNRAQQCWQWEELHGHFQEHSRPSQAHLVLTLSCQEETNKIIFSAAGKPCVRKIGIFGVECVLWHNLSIPPVNRYFSPHLPLLSNFAHYIITDIKGLFSRVSPLLLI